MGLLVTIKGWERLGVFVVAVVCLGGGAGCSKKAEASGASAADAASDGASDGALPSCADDGGASDAATSEAGVPSELDEFGPNAPAAKTESSIGRVNIYAVTSPRVLDRVDVYLGSRLSDTRLTIAVQEAPSLSAPFQRLFDLQLDFGACEGWATTGPIAVPLIAGHYYAIGLDPNQPVTAFVSADANALPIDGAFGRLVSAKTTTSVSTSGLTWDKATSAEFNRQRLATSVRTADGRDVADAAADGPIDAGVDGPADAGVDGTRG